MKRSTSDRLLSALTVVSCLSCVNPCLSQVATESTEPDRSADEIIDTDDSIDDADSRLGWSSSGDFRGMINYNDEDARDGARFDDYDMIGRLRVEGTWAFTPSVRLSARLAGSCTDDDCDLGFELDKAVSGSTLERGKFTFDELFLHVFRSDRFDVAIGRMQTKLVTRAGVFAKSLDRADSDNANITWTDGFHGTMQHASGWETQVFVQHNSAGGAGNVRRSPLDFSSGSSRLSYVVALENTRPAGVIVQRAFDVNYLPKSLQKDGVSTGRVEDYWGFVGRLVAEWPLGDGDARLRIAGEAAYAPETPARSAVDLGTSGDVGGTAWNVVVSLQDFRPGHSIGLNYGRIDPGWLLSPDFGDNEEQIEIRYRWTISQSMFLELRARTRKDLEQRGTAVQKRDRFDVFLRATWRFSKQTL